MRMARSPVPRRTIPSPASLLLTFFPLWDFFFSFSKPFPPQHLCFCPTGAPAGLLSFAGAEGLNCHYSNGTWPISSLCPSLPSSTSSLPSPHEGLCTLGDLRRTQQSKLFSNPPQLGQMRDSPSMYSQNEFGENTGNLVADMGQRLVLLTVTRTLLHQ